MRICVEPFSIEHCYTPCMCYVVVYCPCDVLKLEWPCIARLSKLSVNCGNHACVMYFLERMALRDFKLKYCWPCSCMAWPLTLMGWHHCLPPYVDCGLWVFFCCVPCIWKHCRSNFLCCFLILAVLIITIWWRKWKCSRRIVICLTG